MELKTCLYCGNKYEPKRYGQKFCHKKCKFKFYKEQDFGFPKYICQVCNKTFDLDFDPTDSKGEKLKTTYCPHCNHICYN